jgi:DNA-binding winged helix-turn-helix (wHTH) protein/tetratricopeptide (TPR) repeat protein
MSEPVQTKIRFGSFHIPVEIDLLYRGNEVVQLEPRAVQVLRYLATHADRVITKEELLENVWPDVFTTDAVLKKAISQARRALGDDADESKFIRTFHARGYQFIADVKCADADKPREAGTSGRAQSSQNAQNDFAASTRITNQPITSRLKIAPAPAGRVSREIIFPHQVPDFDQLAGRESEFQTLGSEYRNTLRQMGKPVLMTGEPGLGKTQMARYFIRWAQAQQAQCLYARFFDYRGSHKAPFETFLLLLRSIIPTETDQELREIAATQLGVKLPDELFAGSSRGLVQTSEARTGNLLSDHFRVIVPLTRAFIQISRQQPLVMIFDDLQWADEESREMIGYLMRTSANESLMVMLLARASEAADTQHPLSLWLMNQADYRSFTSLALQPLSDLGCQATVAAIFGGTTRAPEIPPLDWQTLSQLVQGNPYFLTEMLRLLVAEGAIRPPANPPARWQWQDLGDLHLPQSLVMAARHKIERMSPETRAVIECAAVIGDEFRVETLVLLSHQPEEAIEEALMEALRLGILSERGVSAGEDCRFHHSLLRRVLYEEIPRRRRKKLHTSAASVLEKVYARQPDLMAEAISAHYEAAGNEQATLEWSLRAWQAASSRWQWRKAVICIERAARVVDEMKKRGTSSLRLDDHLRVMIGMSESYCASGRVKDAARAAASAVALAEAIENPGLLAAALTQQSQALHGCGQYLPALAPAQRALEIYQQNDDQAGASLALLQISSSRIALGEYHLASPLIEQVLHQAKSGSRIASIANGLLGWAKILQGRFAEGTPLLESSIKFHTNAGDVWQQAHLLRRWHWALLCQGQYEQAVSVAHQARRAYRDVGDSLGEAKMMLGVGEVRLAQRLYSEGRRLIEQSLEKLRRIEDVHCEAEALRALGRVDYLTGNFAEAESRLHYALEMIREIGDRDDEFRLLTDLARFNLLDHQPQDALAFIDSAIAIAGELKNDDGLGAALICRAEIRLQQKQSESALIDARRGVELLKVSGSGELWQAHQTLAQALLASGKKGTISQALESLRSSLQILDGFRAELKDNEPLYHEMTAALNQSAQEYVRLLESLDKTQEAAEIKTSWMIS